MTVGEQLSRRVREMQPSLAVPDCEARGRQIAAATRVWALHPLALIHRADGLS